MFANNLLRNLALVATVVGTVAGFATESSAYRMIQVPTWPGTYTSGFAVRCDDWGGFAHWGQRSDSWYLNPAYQGNGRRTPLVNALSSWTRASGYTLRYGGTTNRRLSASDRRNVVFWASPSGALSPNLLALTFITTDWNQTILDTDVVFNNNYNWSNNGGSSCRFGRACDTEAVMAHELGHCMGIHHTESNSTPWSTMRGSYFGAGGRSLENDDRIALTCAYLRYPPSSAVNGPSGEVEMESERHEPVRGGLSAESRFANTDPDPVSRVSFRPAQSGTIVRYSLPEGGDVTLEIFDVMGRRVATLADGYKAEGDHETWWDGSTGSGTAGSGVYFGRFRDPSKNEIKKKFFFAR